MGVAQRGLVVNEVKPHGHEEQEPVADHAAVDRRTLLLVRLGDSDQVAIPLEKVARLEEFPRDAVERSSNHDVVRYRDRILRLVRVADVLGFGSFRGAERDQRHLHVVVYTHHERSIGLVVDAILDIVEEEVDLSSRAEVPGILGSAIIQERVTDILDIEEVIQSVDPSFFETRLVA
jgi:two-component system chemotaxis sensor kinase CheA